MQEWHREVRTSEQLNPGFVSSDFIRILLLSQITMVNLTTKDGVPYKSVKMSKKNEVRDEASKCEEPLDSYEDLS